MASVVLAQMLGCATQPAEQLEDGVRAYREGRVSDAELIWLEALAESEAYGEEDPRLHQSLRVLANLQIQQARYDEAQPLLERWMMLVERRGEALDGGFADGVDALAGIHMVKREYAEAAALYERSVSVRENDSALDNLALAETLEYLGRARMAMGESERAEVVLERALAIRRQALGDSDPSLASTVHGLGRIAHERGDFPAAQERYHRALELLEGEPDEALEAEVRTRLGALHRVVGRYDAALQELEQARALRTDLFGESHETTAATVDEIANVRAEQRELEDAEELHRWVLAVRSDVFGLDSLPVASTLNNLALVHLYARAYDEAVPLLERALQIRHQHPEGQRRELAAVYTNLGLVRHERDELEKAETALRIALEIQEPTLGVDHPETAMTLHDLADVVLEAGRLDEADAHLRRALLAKERAFGPEHPRVADTALLMGVLQASREQNELAEASLRRAIAIWDATPVPDPVPQAEALANLALLRQMAGATDEALALYERAIPALGRGLGEAHPQTQRARAHRAAAWAAQGRRQEAMREYQRQVDDATAAGAPPADVARPLLRLATARLEAGDLDRAAEDYARAVALLDKARPAEERALAFALGGLADARASQQRLDAAVPLYERALGLLAKDAAPRERGALQANLAAAYAERGRAREAATLFPEAVATLTDAYGARHALVARVLHAEAVNRLALGEPRRAREGFEAALAIRQEVLDGNHRELAESLTALGELSVEAGQSDGAEPLLLRALAVHEANPHRDPIGLGRTLGALGRVHVHQQRLPQAVRELEQALGLLEPELGPADPRVLEIRRQYDLARRELSLGSTPASIP